MFTHGNIGSPFLLFHAKQCPPVSLQESHSGGGDSASIELLLPGTEPDEVCPLCSSEWRHSSLCLSGAQQLTGTSGLAHTDWHTQTGTHRLALAWGVLLRSVKGEVEGELGGDRSSG